MRQIKDYHFNFDKPDPQRTITIPDIHSDGKPDVVLPTGPYSSIVEKDHVVHRKWRGWIGTFIADNLDRDLSRPWHLQDFPTGYTLICTERQSVKERFDYHLYGYGRKTTFDSPREFAFHAVWLFHRDYHDHHKCQCTLCTNRKQGYINSIWIGIPGYERKDQDDPNSNSNTGGGGAQGYTTLVTSATRSTFVRWIHLRRSLLDAGRQFVPIVAPDRAMDLTLTRPYRFGELVWVCIDPLLPHPDAVPDPEEEPIIAFWPAFIQKPTGRDRRPARPSSPLEAQDLETPEYTIQLLGVENLHKVPLSMILSWRAYTLPRIVSEQIQDPRMPVDVSRLMLDLANFHPLPIEPKAPLADVSRAGQRPMRAFRPIGTSAEIPRTYENALGPLSLAHRKAEYLQARYCGTDEYEGFDEEKGGAYKCYQGIWWGAERIWVGDLVRLTCTRVDLEQEALLADRLVPPKSKEAAGRPLMARITEIVFDEQKNQVCFSAELFELERTNRARERASSTTTSGLPTPPTHFRFRKVTPPDVLIYLPIQTISGRYDPLPLESEAHRDLLQGAITDENFARLESGELEDTELGETLKEVLTLSGLREDQVIRIRPSLLVEARLGRESILRKADREAKGVTYEKWDQFKERERMRREQDVDGDSVMSD